MAASWKEDWKKDLGDMLVKFVIGGLWVSGIILLTAYGKKFLLTLKPTYDIEYVIENGAKEGMHVSGEVPYIYDCFANLSDTDDGRISAYYYALPAADGILVLHVPVSLQEAMDTLLEETMLFLDTGVWPTSTVPMEGYVVKAQGRLPYLLTQYMLEIGYTREEIAGMGDPLMIDYAVGNLRAARLYAPVGMILLALGILLLVFVIFWKRARTTGR